MTDELAVSRAAVEMAARFVLERKADALPAVVAGLPAADQGLAIGLMLRSLEPWLDIISEIPEVGAFFTSVGNATLFQLQVDPNFPEGER